MIGKGTFAIVEKGRYLGATVVVKKLHTGTTVDVTNVFMKEAKILSVYIYTYILLYLQNHV